MERVANVSKWRIQAPNLSWLLCFQVEKALTYHTGQNRIPLGDTTDHEQLRKA